MKFKRVLKIILLAINIIFTMLLVLLMYSVLIVEESDFEYSMLIPLFLILTGVFSIIFHFRTLELYKTNRTITEFKNLTLWIVNVVFALTLIATALLLIYVLLEGDFREEDWVFILLLAIFFTMIMLGTGLIVEERYLYNLILRNKKDAFVEQIDAIEGHKNDI